MSAVVPLGRLRLGLGPLGGMKRIPAIMGLLFLYLIALGGWYFQPWMPAGRAVFIGTWRFGSTEFQVWQRKTDIWSEPFGTGLFVRTGTNHWQVFCINIDDYYSPSVHLRAEKNRVNVFKSGRKVAVFDMTTQTYRRGSVQQAHTPVNLRVGIEPPGDWWFKP